MQQECINQIKEKERERQASFFEETSKQVPSIDQFNSLLL
jgi:hypothetical protein